MSGSLYRSQYIVDEFVTLTVPKRVVFKTLDEEEGFPIFGRLYAENPLFVLLFVSIRMEVYPCFVHKHSKSLLTPLKHVKKGFVPLQDLIL